MSSNTGFKGIDVRQTGNELVFDALLTSGGSAMSSGTVTLSLLQLMSDGSLQTYDFHTNTFTAGAVTTLTQSMSQQTYNNGSSNTGIWTYSLGTLTGFTVGSICYAYVRAGTSDTPIQVRKFQYGSEQGDLVVTSTGTGTANLNSDAKAINAVSTSSLTTVNANIGTTQPINFTGTGGSALVQASAAGGINNYITVPAAIAQASQNPSQITCLRGDTLSVALPLMGDIAGRMKLIMTVKLSVNDPDEQAILQIVEGTGLLILNGVSTTSVSWASLTVTNATTGAINLVIDAQVTCLLVVEDLVWDVQAYLSTGIITPICGVFSVVADVTRTVI